MPQKKTSPKQLAHDALGVVSEGFRISVKEGERRLANVPPEIARHFSAPMRRYYEEVVHPPQVPPLPPYLQWLRDDTVRYFHEQTERVLAGFITELNTPIRL
jgi:hypothetical protein